MRCHFVGPWPARCQVATLLSITTAAQRQLQHLPFVKIYIFTHLNFFNSSSPAAIFYYCCAACHLLAVVCCCTCANVATPACNGTNIVYWLFAVTVATDATDATARASVCDCNYVCGLCCGCMHSKSALAHMPPCVSMHVATCAYRLSNALQMALR